MAFLPDGAILITERPGRLRVVRNGVLDPDAGRGSAADSGAGPRRADGRAAPSAVRGQQAGLPHVSQAAGAARPARAAAGAGTAAAAATRFRPASSRSRADAGTAASWSTSRIIFSAQPIGNASRIVFGRDGMIYMSVGYGDPPRRAIPIPTHMPPQDPMNLAGKTLRLKDDGTVPPDNPFVGKAGYRPEIYTLGPPQHPRAHGASRRPARSGRWSTGRTAATRSTSCSRGRTTAGRSSATGASISARASA